jgi:hypothetical protein
MNEKVLNGILMTSSQTSAVKDLGEAIGFAAHFIWSGTPTGSVLCEGSNDGVNFVVVNTQSTGGAAGQHLVNVERMHYKYVRLSYEFTSGTGTLTSHLSAKRG